MGWISAFVEVRSVFEKLKIRKKARAEKDLSVLIKMLDKGEYRKSSYYFKGSEEMNKIDSIIIHCSANTRTGLIYVQKILTVCTDKEGLPDRL